MSKKILTFLDRLLKTPGSAFRTNSPNIVMSNRQNSNVANTKDASNSNVKEENHISNVKSNENCETLEKILNIPGLYHLAENIFGNLNVEDLEVSREINKSSKQIMDDPMFWLRKFRHLSKENQKDWIKVIQSVRNTEKEREIISYLKWNFKKQAVIDLPCFTSSTVQDKFKKKIFQNCGKAKPSNQSIEILKILAPLTDNPNAPDEDGKTPIHWAANRGHTEIVKILAPLTNHPNAPNEDGDTPIHHAASMGHTEIVKILAPLTDNPNAPNNSGETPSLVAENSEIRRFLESYNPSGKSKTEPSTMPSNKRAKKF